VEFFPLESFFSQIRRIRFQFGLRVLKFISCAFIPSVGRVLIAQNYRLFLFNWVVGSILFFISSLHYRMRFSCSPETLLLFGFFWTTCILFVYFVSDVEIDGPRIDVSLKK
jgi:hypothetical protein